MKKKYIPRNVRLTLLAIFAFWFSFWPLYNVQQQSEAEVAYNSDELFIIVDNDLLLHQGSPFFFLRALSSSKPLNTRKENCYIFHLKKGKLTKFTFENAVAPQLALHDNKVYLRALPEDKQPRFFRWTGDTFEAISDAENVHMEAVVSDRGSDTFQNVPGWSYVNANDVLVTARDSTQIPIKLSSGTYQFMMRQSYSQDWQRYLLKGANLPEQSQELLFVDKTRSTFVSRSAYGKYSGSKHFVASIG